MYEIRDAGDLRKYFAMIPHSIDDLNLSVYAYRLYGHLKRVAGEDGKCWQNQSTLAKACNMSTGSIVKAKNELIDSNLIQINKEKSNHGGKPYHLITITDIWIENSIKYMDKQKSPGDIAMSLRDFGSISKSRGDFAKSRGELKEEPIKKNPLIEEKPLKKSGRCFIEYENNIGLLIPLIADELIELENQYSEQWIIDAIHIAVEQNHRKLSYIKGILKNWGTDGRGKEKSTKQLTLAELGYTDAQHDK